MSSSSPLLRGTHIPRVFGGGVYLVDYVLLICVFLFYEERASPSYLYFRVYLVIYLLSPAHLRASLFYLELASPGYLGFGVYLIINLLSSDSLRDSLFYLELTSPGYLGFGVFFNYQLAIFLPVCVPSFSTWNAHPPAIWVLELIYLSTCFLPPVSVPFSSTWNSLPWLFGFWSFFIYRREGGGARSSTYLRATRKNVLYRLGV